jgi:hypothetical protein
MTEMVRKPIYVKDTSTNNANNKTLYWDREKLYEEYL